MCIAAPSKLSQWVIYCTYTDENNSMDTVPDFQQPGYKMFSQRQRTAPHVKLFPLIKWIFCLWLVAVIDLSSSFHKSDGKLVGNGG